MNVHKNDLVVVLRTLGDNKPLREFPLDPNKDSETLRARKVYIPSGSEYSFLFKNYQPTRRRVSIEIDGSSVGEWIILGGTKNNPAQTVIERYLEEARHFRATSVSDDAVADPGNSSNGTIRVVAFDELPECILSTPSVPWQQPLTPWPQWPTNPRPYWESNPLIGTGQTSIMYCSSTNNDSGMLSCSSLDSSRSVPEPGEKLATVAGSASMQTFASTFWRGDNAATRVEFVFSLLAAQKTVAAKYCSACGIKRQADANFCSACGQKF